MIKRKQPEPTEQSRSRRERILDAAFTTFAGRGYRDASMDDIAAAAETSKGGVYFHFSTKESIFRELMRTTADKLVAKVERAVASEPDPIAQAEIAIQTVLAVFSGHRTMARLLFLDGIGAGRVFQAEANALHERFAALIQGYLDQAVADGVIPATDTRVTSIAWFGALNEVVGRWLQADQPERLEDAYPTLRATLLRSVGVVEERIGRLPAPSAPSAFPEVAR
jgi:AcrR family transcriptional regulator